ncbi:MAG: four helix bundle protein [Ignavibacteria bacterium]
MRKSYLCWHKEVKYNLDIQIRKASISITANIAEGYGRYQSQEGVQFIESQELPYLNSKTIS